MAHWTFWQCLVAAPIYLACSSFELPETCRSSTAPYDILEAVSALAANDRTSAIPDAGDFLKWLSVKPAGMSGFNFSEPLHFNALIPFIYPGSGQSANPNLLHLLKQRYVTRVGSGQSANPNLLHLSPTAQRRRLSSGQSANPNLLHSHSDAQVAQIGSGQSANPNLLH